MAKTMQNRQSGRGNPREGFVRNKNSSQDSNCYNPYVFGSAAPALDPASRPSRISPKNSDLEKQQKRFFRIVQGAKPNANEATLSVPLALKAFSVAIILIAIIGVVSITFSSMSVAMAVQQQNLQSEINQAREEGRALEVQYGILSNPTRVKDKASSLGMSVADNSIQINLADNSAKTDCDGNLLLATTINTIIKN